jgi:hypothetical protein
LEFTDLLRINGIDPSDVALALHKPTGDVGRRALCAMAENDLPAFDAYQSTHPRIPQATLARRPLMASFVLRSPTELTFAGLYRQVGSEVATVQSLVEDVDFMRMWRGIARNQVGPNEGLGIIAGRLRFQIVADERLSELQGRLVVVDPGVRNYMRLAETTPLTVVEVMRRPSLVPDLPQWDHVILSAADVRTLPREWAQQLAAWRGIYLIVDETKGERYVGSAYGVDNLFGRWRDHVAGERGVTKELSKLKTEGFRFSILELLSPAADIVEVTQKERSWMARLGTIDYGLNG